MSDSRAEVDLDSLTQAIEQLHLATGSLARAVRGPPASSSDDWIFVPSESQPAVPTSKDPSPPIRLTRPLRTLVPDPTPSPLAPLSFGLGLPLPLPTWALRACCIWLLALHLLFASSAPAELGTLGSRPASFWLAPRDYPDSTPPLQVRSRFYVVLRNGRGGEPACYNSFTGFKRDVGALSGSDTVCHGFPTQGEGQIYAAAAGVPLPRILP